MDIQKTNSSALNGKAGFSIPEKPIFGEIRDKEEVLKLLRELQKAPKKPPFFLTNTKKPDLQRILNILKDQNRDEP